MRKRNGEYWTVQHTKVNGETENIGHYPTLADLLARAYDELENFPETGTLAIVTVR